LNFCFFFHEQIGKEKAFEHNEEINNKMMSVFSSFVE